MESLNALIQGMGLMHLGAGQAVMLLVSLLLLWLAIAKKFEPLLLLPIGFGGLLSNIPEAGLALTALESLLAHHDPAQLAVIAAKLHCAPDVHAIKEALALALPSVQGQMESLAVDMGYSAGVLAIFYKVAIGSGIAPLVIFMGVGAMTDFGPLLANPRTLLLGAAAQFGIFATVLGALTLNYFGIISFTLPQAAAIGIIGGADGSQGVEQSGSGSGRAELPADARHGPERGRGDRLGDRRRGNAQVRAGDVGQPVPAAGIPAAEISHKETVMNEAIACCPENRTSTREAVVDAMLASGDELAQLQPALNLLSPPLNATPGEALLASCYEAGADHNADEATRAVIALPAAVVRSATPSLQRSGLLCMAAGALSARQLPLTHNRLCDVAGQFARAIPEGDEEAGSGFYTVRSVSLPVYRRLRRDNHSHSVCLQQALLHLLAWKSESPWARQQAQRLLWQGGVLGEKGEFALLTLDDELRERQIVWPGLRSLLAVTGFLVRFPAGPVFSD